MELVVVNDAKQEALGAVTYWSLSGIESLEDFRRELTAAGFGDEFRPTDPTDEQVLKRAVQAAANKRQLVRNVSRGHYALIQEVTTQNADGEEELSYVTLLHAAVKGEGVRFTVTRKTTEGDKWHEESAAALVRVREGVQQYTDEYTSDDLAVWLRQAVERLMGLGLRPRGGVYFVPRESLKRWESLVSVVQNCGNNTVYNLPAVDCAQAVESVLDSVSAKVGDLFETVDTYLAGDVTKRGLASQERTLTQAKAVLEHYCGLLGRTLPVFSERLTQLSGALAAATLMTGEAAE